jgi:hypothetical protein
MSRQDDFSLVAKGLEDARFALMLVAAWSADCNMTAQRKSVDQAIAAFASIRKRGESN